ncbi:MAG: 23S rRNA (pseudouridine(1915)-N(3))-methyltransferase RlmH [Acetatifactor sp.]
MKITIVCVGRIKEKFYRDAVAEYEKRLGKYCRMEIIEVPDEKTPDGASPQQEEQIKAKEGQRILEKLKDDAFVCTLEINGKKMSSVEMAEWMKKLTLGGTSQITFVIGGSLGLHDSVCKRADTNLSFSDMTFPHQLMRVILTEQVYRAFRIIHNEPYHK